MSFYSTTAAWFGSVREHFRWKHHYKCVLRYHLVVSDAGVRTTKLKIPLLF